MSVLKIYARVLGLLRPQARLAIILVGANLSLAIAQFAEPLLFGRIIDRMTQAQAPGPDADLERPAAAPRAPGPASACSRSAAPSSSASTPTGSRIAAGSP